MIVHRNKGELFLGGTMPSFIGPSPYGWLQKINPNNLDILKESRELNCGDHVWCGAIAVNKDGNIVKGGALPSPVTDVFGIKTSRVLHYRLVTVLLFQTAGFHLMVVKH